MNVQLDLQFCFGSFDIEILTSAFLFVPEAELSISHSSTVVRDRSQTTVFFSLLLDVYCYAKMLFDIVSAPRNLSTEVTGTEDLTELCRREK